MSEDSSVEEVFFPYARERRLAAAANGGRFAYYTSAETAFLILRKKEIWLRNAQLMNDFSEVQHGMRCLQLALTSEGVSELRSVLDVLYPGVWQEVLSRLDGASSSIYLDTYLNCVSEHLPTEDRTGRLSMWRAYGGRTGVALIINGTAMFGESAATDVTSSPVLYATPDEFGARLEVVARGVAKERQLLTRIGRDGVANAVFHMLRFAALCVKHPSFSEELEWRNIASPTLTGEQGVVGSLEVVDGVPQRVLRLSLSSQPEKGLRGLSIPELVDRVLIGPCAFPQVTAMAFAELLYGLGVPDPGNRVVIADVPLRSNW